MTNPSPPSAADASIAEMKRVKLTKAQWKFLRDANRGCDGIPPEVLIGGEVRMSQRLQERGLIDLRNVHPITGRMHQAFYLTNAGRALLAGAQHD